MKVSVAIPTRNRPESLGRLLRSLLNQTRLPEEILVIDDSSDARTETMIKDYLLAFSSNGIALRHLYGKETNKSISAARNIGITESSGDILFFIDDDIILFKNYIEEILKVYESYPMAKGVQGYIVNGSVAFSNFGNFVLNAVKKLFLLDHVEKNKCVIRSGLVYPYSPNGVIKCEWLHGSNMSFRKEAIGFIRFDEKLKNHSIGEDVTFTSKIREQYSDSLFMNSQAKVLHIWTTKRKLVKSVTCSNIPYLVYLSSTKGRELTLREYAGRFWYSIGVLLVDGGVPLIASKDAQPLFCLAKSFFSTLRHLNDTKKGDFRFIESMK